MNFCESILERAYKRLPNIFCMSLSDRRRKPVSTRAVVGFAFGSAGCGSQSTVFYLSLLNSGAVPAEWY